MKEERLQEEMNRYYQIWREASKAYEEWAKQKKITYNYVLILMALLENKDSCTQKIICDYWQLPKQTVNTILKDFEDKGYVYLKTLETDKRNKLILLTKSGEKYATKITQDMRSQDIYAANKLGLENLIKLNDNLSLFLDYFKEAGFNKE